MSNETDAIRETVAEWLRFNADRIVSGEYVDDLPDGVESNGGEADAPSEREFGLYQLAAVLEMADAFVRMAGGGEDSVWRPQAGVRDVFETLAENLTAATTHLYSAYDNAETAHDTRIYLDRALERLDVVTSYLEGEQPDRWARQHPAGVKGIANELHGLQTLVRMVVAQLESEEES